MATNIYVVVGGAKVGGIGIAVTELLSQSGKVIMTGFNQAEVDEGVRYLKTKNIEVVAQVCDVLKADDIDHLVKTAVSTGKIKGVVVVTGLTPTCGNWKLLIEVSLLGVIELLKAFGAVMESGSSFVLFGSSSPYMLKRDILDKVEGLLYEADNDPDFMKKITPFALQAGEQMACSLAYPIAKRGIHLMARKYAVLLGEKGIRVNSISPGLADTVRNQEELKRDSETETKRMWHMVNTFTPFKRMGTCQEMANVVEFLLSDKASFVSGVDILVDGGCLANMRLKKLIDN
ncbi:SDR family oxidoreductase [Moorellaceae bacterium AZ2]